MGFIKVKRFRQVLLFGWKDAGEISRYPDVTRSRISIFLDIWRCFRKYNLFSNQYKVKKFWTITDDERLDLAQKLGNANLKKDNWIDVHYGDWKFLSKYTSIRWQKSPKRIKKRNNAYARHYGLPINISVQYGVTFICEHFLVGKIQCGEHVLFARNVDIDYTGDLTIGDNVKISEGAKILTHNHELTSNGIGDSIITRLFIDDNVWIGAHALILPGVSEIGRGAIIGAGAVIKKRIPPYAVVVGNPGKIVRFSFSPEEVERLESSLPNGKRTDIKEYILLYNEHNSNRV